MTDACPNCGSPLAQPKTGRRRVYCSRRCSRAAERRRRREQARVDALAAAVDAVEAAELRLALALAARAAAEPDPLEPAHRFATYESIAELRGASAQGGAPISAEDYLRAHGGEPE